MIKIKFTNRFWIYLMLVALLALGGFLRFNKTQLILFTPDSAGYFFLAAHYHIADEIRGYCVRSFPYQMTLLGIIKIFGSIEAIAISQHLSSLVAGILFFLSVRIFIINLNLKGVGSFIAYFLLVTANLSHLPDLSRI